MNQLFSEFGNEGENQGALELDDGSGLRVVRAEFIGEEKFSWDLFRGYDTRRQTRGSTHDTGTA